MKILSTFVIPLAGVFLLAQSPSSYRVTHTYTLGGDGNWDYVVPDPPNHRLFIARQNRVMVVDEENGALLGEVAGIKGAHGTALAGSSGHGFATAGDDQAVMMFNAKTFKSLKRIPAAEDADAIIYGGQVSRRPDRGDSTRVAQHGPRSCDHRLYVVSAKFGAVPPRGRRGPVVAGSFAVLAIEQ